MRPGRVIAGLAAVIAALVALAAITLGVLLWRFDPNSYKPRIEAAVYDATGLHLTLNGPIGLAWALRPTITLDDVVVRNPPGFSSPDLARVQRVALRLDLPALISRHVVVQSLVLQHPQITLERAVSNAANWELPKRPQPPAANPAAPAQPSAARRRSIPFAIQQVRVTDLDLAYHDDRTGAAVTAALPLLELSAPSARSPTELLARGQANRTRFELNAQAASLEQITSDGSPLPVTARLRATDPAGNLSAELTAPSADQPVHLVLSGQYRAQPVSLTADLGPWPGAGPLRVNVQANAAGSTAALAGAVGDPARLSGVNLALTAASPDLAPLAALLRTNLPDLRAMKLSARLRDVNGLGQGLAIDDLHLVSDKGTLGGTVRVGFAPHRAVTAELHGPDLDLAAFRMTGPAPAPAQAPAAPARPEKPQAGHLIPDTELPFAALRRDSADLTLRLDRLQAGKEAFSDVRAEAHLKDGILNAKTHAVFAGAPADIVATVDARPAAPAVAVVASAPALPAGPLLQSFGAPDFVSGKLKLTANLHGAGQTPHLIASSLTGDASLSMQGGTISAKMLERSFGPAIARANPLAVLAHGDKTALRCLAVRAKAVNGQVALDPLLLSSDLLTVGGSGKINLAAETIDLTLRPEGRVGSTAFSVPLNVGGPLRNPRVELVKGRPAEAIIGLLQGITAPLSGVPSCASALDRPAGQVSAPAASPAAIAKKPALPKPADLLRQFLR